MSRAGSRRTPGRSAGSAPCASPRRAGRGSRRSTPAVAASLVSGATNGTWSISCSEPWPQRNAGARPPSTSIGEWFCCAEAIALIPLVTPGTGGQRAHAGRARDLRPALGRERRRLLVAGVDELDPLLAAAVVDREQVPAGEREQLADPVAPRSAARDQAPAVQLRLGRLGGHRRRTLTAGRRRARPTSSSSSGGSQAQRVDDRAAEDDQRQHVEPAEHDQDEHDRASRSGRSSRCWSVSGKP